MADVTIFVKAKKDTKKPLDAVKREAKSTFKDIEKSAKKSSDNIKRAYGSIKNVVGGVLGIQGARALINTMGTIEQGWIGIAKTTGFAGAELSDLKIEIKDLAREMKGIKLEEFQSIAETAGQLGIRGVDNITAFTKTIAKMKVATDLTAEAAAEDMAQIANVMKIAIPDIEKLGSVMNELSNTTTATAADLSNMTKRMAGAGKTLGLTTAEIVGISASLKDMGVNLEVGGTAMSQIFTKMLSDTEKFAEVAGVSVEEFAETVRTKPVEALRQLLSSMSEMSKFEAAKSLEELGVSGVRVGGVLLKLSGGIDILDKNLKTANDEWERGTSLQDEYAVASKSLFAEATSVSNVLKILADDMSVTLLPAIKELLGWFRTGIGLLDSFGKFLGETAAKASLLAEDILGAGPGGDFSSGGLFGMAFPDETPGGAAASDGSDLTSFSLDSSAPTRSFAKGTRRVSKTGPAIVHQGEEIRNPREVSLDNRRNSRVEINLGGITIQGTNKSPEQLAKEIVVPLDRELKNLQALE